MKFSPKDRNGKKRRKKIQTKSIPQLAITLIIKIYQSLLRFYSMACNFVTRTAKSEILCYQKCKAFKFNSFLLTHIQNLFVCVDLLRNLFLSEKYQFFMCMEACNICMDFLYQTEVFSAIEKRQCTFPRRFTTCNLHSIQLFGSFIPDQLSGIFCAGQGFNHFAFLCFRN